MSRVRKIAGSLLFMLVVFVGFGQKQVDLQPVIEQKAFQPADLGIIIKNLSTSDILGEYHADKRLVPASVLKVHTAAGAWETFGPSHRFRTTVSLIGEVDQGTLFGYVVVQSEGDPTLNGAMTESVRTRQIADDVLGYCIKNQIQCIEGIRVDASYFSLPGIPQGYIQQDVANYYGAGSYGVNVNDNLFPITFDRSRNGQATVVSFDSMACRFVTSNVKAKGRSDQAYAYFHPESGGIHVTGTIPEGTGTFTIKAAIRNPPGYLAAQLQNLLESGGLSVVEDSEVLWTPVADQRHLLWSKSYDSPTLEDILIPVLHKSNNMYAETLHRHVLKSEAAKKADKLVDGSGLSPINRISANELLHTLEQIYSNPDFNRFLDCMPKNGEDGTVTSVLRDTPGRLFIKSGYIGGVRSYIGFRQTDLGDWVAFVCIANELQCSPTTSRLAWERLLKKLIEM